MADDATLAGAELAGSARPGGMAAPFAFGSEAHKTAFCRMLIDTHDPYNPAIVAWPALDGDARRRILGLPIWDVAVCTEGKARLRVLSYAETIGDPLLRRAVELDAFEEGRHKEVLAGLVAAYGIPLLPEPEYLRPHDPEWAFLVTGFSECIDSVFAFGLFALARESGFFPAALVDTFEPIMQEEARHILFFVNWVAWHRRNLRAWRRLIFAARVAAVWVFLLWERIGIARGMQGEPAEAAADNNFTLTGSRVLGGSGVSAAGLFALCLAENAARLSSYDARLLRPRAVPRLLRLLCCALRGVSRS